MRKALVVVAVVIAAVAGGVAAAQALRGEGTATDKDGIVTKQATPSDGSSDSTWDSDRMQQASPAPMPGG